MFLGSRTSVRAPTCHIYVLVSLCSSVSALAAENWSCCASSYVSYSLLRRLRPNLCLFCFFCPYISRGKRNIKKPRSGPPPHPAPQRYVLQHTSAKYPLQRLAYTPGTSTFAPLEAYAPPASAKNARFFLHAATCWHSARYVRFKRNSRKFLQNFFAKNLVRAPKVRTFALANQKWGLQHLANLKQFDLWKHYIKLFCREVQETKWALFI